MPNKNAWYMEETIKQKFPFISHGKDVYIAHTAYVDKRAPIELGDNVTICDWVKILTHDYSPVMHGGQEKVAGLKIGKKVFIGIQSIILPGITIGDNVVVGAGAVVTKDLPSNGVYAGNPAKKVKEINTQTQ